MYISAEYGLMLSVIGLYLYDSSCRLHCNEAFLCPVGRHGWRVVFASRWWQLGGKELFIPNPLTFYRPLFRLSWSLEGQGAQICWQPPTYPFARLRPYLFIVAIALFILLPLGLFSVFSTPALVLALVLTYPSIVLALWVLWRERHAFSLSGARFAALAFESLVCPPLALNMIRHVSRELVINADLVASACHLQSAATLPTSLRQFMLRIEEEIAYEAPNSQRFAALHTFHRQLEAHLSEEKV